MFGTIKNLFGNKVDLKTLIQEGAIIVDVRTAGEFKSGHAPKSINMPLDALNIKKIATIRKANHYLLCIGHEKWRSSQSVESSRFRGLQWWHLESNRAFVGLIHLLEDTAQACSIFHTISLSNSSSLVLVLLKSMPFDFKSYSFST